MSIEMKVARIAFAAFGAAGGGATFSERWGRGGTLRRPNIKNKRSSANNGAPSSEWQYAAFRFQGLKILKFIGAVFIALF